MEVVEFNGQKVAVCAFKLPLKEKSCVLELSRTAILQDQDRTPVVEEPQSELELFHLQTFSNNEQRLTCSGAGDKVLKCSECSFSAIIKITSVHLAPAALNPIQ